MAGAADGAADCAGVDCAGVDCPAAGGAVLPAPSLLMTAAPARWVARVLTAPDAVAGGCAGGFAALGLALGAIGR